MSVCVLHTELHLLAMRTRMPFRYGIAEMSNLAHLFVTARVRIDGAESVGVAAENLPPKWFTKDPTTTYDDDIPQMLDVVGHACRSAQAIGECESVFALWKAVYDRQAEWARDNGIAPLLAAFGPSLIERAAIEAFCRTQGVPFGRAVRDDLLGVRLGEIHPELEGSAASELLPAEPLRRIVVRHTVGLSDPLADSDIPEGDRLDDGLPQSLEAAVRTYGLTHFKIKLMGDAERDLTRLASVARVLRAACRARPQMTLDANEQYNDADALMALLHGIEHRPDLSPIRLGLIFLEQPLHRDIALGDRASAVLRAAPTHMPVIVDESDSELRTVAEALRIGYSGTSHKNCKGVFKGIANACLIEWMRRRQPERHLVLSGEDLTTVGPVGLQQDLAVHATLGIEHVERNGHHYLRGLSMLPEEMQRAMLAAHPDLYRRTLEGLTALSIRDGAVTIGSVLDAPFGVGCVVDASQFTPVEQWSPEMLRR